MEGVDPEPTPQHWPGSQLDFYHRSYCGDGKTVVWYRYIQSVRIKEQRLSGLSVLGAVAVVPAGLYSLRIYRDSLILLDSSGTLMVEDGEISEWDCRSFS